MRAFLVDGKWRKTCCTCRVTKSIDEFYRTTNTVDGRKHRCAECERRVKRESKQRREPEETKIYTEYEVRPDFASPEKLRLHYEWIASMVNVNQPAYKVDRLLQSRGLA